MSTNVIHMSWKILAKSSLSSEEMQSKWSETYPVDTKKSDLAKKKTKTYCSSNSQKASGKYVFPYLQMLFPKHYWTIQNNNTELLHVR